MKHLDLFSGIGGFALAVDTVWPGSEHTFCEIDPFCVEVLKKHWPNSKIHGDIRTLTNTRSIEQRGISDQRRQEVAEVRESDTGIIADTESGKSGESPEQKGWQDIGGSSCDILTGGFPCQPFSQAGRRKGTADDRYLWPEMLRVIREFHPRWIIGENVGGLVTWNEGMVLEQVHADLESEGYEVQAFIVPAVAVNAPHRRDRVWIVAHALDAGVGSECGTITDERGRTSKDRGASIRQAHRTTGSSRTATADRDASDTKCRSKGSEERRGNDKRPRSQPVRRVETSNWNQNWLEVATRLCGVDDGLPRRMDRNPRLKALGNAIVPQVAEEIMKVIKSLK